MAKIKIHQLKTELGIESKDIIAVLEANGVTGKKPQSALDEQEEAIVRKAFAQKTAEQKPEAKPAEKKQPEKAEVKPEKKEIRKTENKKPENKKPEERPAVKKQPEKAAPLPHRQPEHLPLVLSSTEMMHSLILTGI